jgi:hypothetical protein
MYSPRPPRALFCPCRRLRRALSRRSVPLASLVVLASLTLLFAVAPYTEAAAPVPLVGRTITALHGTNDCDAGKKSQQNCQGQDQQQKQTVTISITNVVTLPPAAPTATPTRPCCITVVTPCCVATPTPPCCMQPVCCVQPTPTTPCCMQPVCCTQPQPCCMPVPTMTMTPCCMQQMPPPCQMTCQQSSCVICTTQQPPTIIILPPDVCTICVP